jgi:FtsP/CotA-like multicopper oxidase with cupredoxin domain
MRRRTANLGLLMGAGVLLAASASGVIWGVQSDLQAKTVGVSSARAAPMRIDSVPMETASMAAMGMDMATMSQSHESAAPASITQLVGPVTAAHVDTFTLTAEPARISLGHGVAVDALTFNGTSPGPTLRVRQGELVVVHLVNHLRIPTTIHWHGYPVPAGEDGVAGVTQDAVQPGQSYTYRFLATVPGTYWYHAHQNQMMEVDSGLFGALVVVPTAPSVRDDMDATVTLHEWPLGRRVGVASNQVRLALNDTVGALHLSARPGAWVRLRLINTANSLHLPTLVGAPFQVVALDGQDLQGPQWLTGTLLPIGAGQRYDIRFQMPAHGTVSVRIADDRRYSAIGKPQIDMSQVGKPTSLLPGPAVVLGEGAPSPTPSVVPGDWFDLASYGTPAPSSITQNSRFDATYTLRLDDRLSFMRGRRMPSFTINGKSSPDTDAIMVHTGELVRIHFVNDSGDIHPMHLHGHTFTVLARDGRPLTGSPVRLDTVLVLPHQSYDVAFLANNPGIWMLHCHDLFHASHGMDMMVMYQGITTPFHEGGPAGNISE